MIEYRITAVRSRETYAMALQEQIGRGDIIVWDEQRIGCMWNKNRTWRSLQEGSHTHACVLDDDAEVVDDFCEIVAMCVSRFPDAIWTFYSNTKSMKDKPKHTPYVELFNKNCRGICTLMPKRLIKPCVDFYEARIAPYFPKWTHEDTYKKMFALLNNIQVMTTIPSLCHALPIKSAIAGHGITKDTDCWQGRKINKAMFMTSDFEVDKRRSMFDTHLPKDAQICVECAEKFKRMKALERL